MSERRYKVPEGGLKAAACADPYGRGETDCRPIVEAFIRWQSENPIVPTDEFVRTFIAEHRAGNIPKQFRFFDQALLDAWQRRMYVEPEPEVPAVIKDLSLTGAKTSMSAGHLDRLLCEAYRRGLAQKEIEREHRSREPELKHPKMLEDLIRQIAAYAPKDAVAAAIYNE